jgi:hypothetical protein
LDEYPIFADDPATLDLLPNRAAFLEAAFSGDYSTFLLKGIFAPGDLGLYTNTTRYSTLTLGEITPMRANGAEEKYHADEFPVPRSTPCLGFLNDPFNDRRQGRFYFGLYARGVGPLMDVFGSIDIFDSGGILRSVSKASHLPQR